MRTFCVVLAAVAVAPALWAQDNPERATIPLSDPSRPATIRVELMHGRISVRGYEGKEVILESRGQALARKSRGEAPPGMRRIDVHGSGLEIQQHNNVVRIEAEHMGNVDVDLQVPVNSNLKLETMTGGVQVQNVSGEIDVESSNGKVTLTNVSGAVVAHSLNGGVVATLDRVSTGKPMSFSTLNGVIDVTFPADVKATVKMKSEHGEIFTDFDIAMKPQSPPTAEQKEGRYKIRFDRAFYGTINGGGPEFQFTTLNGRIYLRKK